MDISFEERNAIYSGVYVHGKINPSKIVSFPFDFTFMVDRLNIHGLLQSEDNDEVHKENIRVCEQSTKDNILVSLLVKH